MDVTGLRLTARERENLYAGLAGAVRLGATAEAALDACRPTRDGALARRVSGARRRAEEGLTLSEALAAAFGPVLPGWEIAVIAAAEGVGESRTSGEGPGEAVVAEVLDGLARYAAAERSATGRLALSFGYAFAVLLLLAAVAAATRWLILPSVETAVVAFAAGPATSLDGARRVARVLPLVVGVVLGVGVAVAIGLRTGGSSFRFRLLSLLPPPVAGTVAGVLPQSAALVRVLRIALRAGGDLLDAVDLALRVARPGTDRLGRDLSGAAQRGGSVSKVLALHGLLPTDLAERLASAERSGGIEQALAGVEAELERRRDTLLEALPGVGAAVATAVCGALLGWFALAVVVPTLTALATGAPL